MSRRTQSHQDLAVCEACTSKLVEPTHWEAAGAGHWRVVLHCPNCDHAREGVFPQETVDLFDENLDQATTQMVNDLRRLEQANFADEAELFIGALHAGAILADDFGSVEVAR